MTFIVFLRTCSGRQFTSLIAAIGCFLFGVIPDASAQQTEGDVQLAERYSDAHEGRDANGDHVIALWGFDEPRPTADLSGNGHVLRLNGAQFVSEGRFGGGLQSARGWPVADEPLDGLSVRRERPPRIRTVRGPA